MDSKIFFLSSMLVVLCVSTVTAAEDLQSPQFEVPRLAKRSTNGGVLLNLFASRSRREAARLAGGRAVNVPRPCFGPKVDLCPYPDLPALCATMEDSPCSETEFLTVDI